MRKISDSPTSGNGKFFFFFFFFFFKKKKKKKKKIKRETAEQFWSSPWIAWPDAGFDARSAADDLVADRLRGGVSLRHRGSCPGSRRALFDEPPGAQVGEQSKQVANALAGLGIEQGDRVADAGVEQ